MQVWEAGRPGVHYLSSLPVVMTVTCGRLQGVVSGKVGGSLATGTQLRIHGDSGSKLLENCCDRILVKKYSTNK